MTTDIHGQAMDQPVAAASQPNPGDPSASLPAVPYRDTKLDARTRYYHNGEEQGYDGPSLRSLRESQGVALRKVARQAAMSHGHLPKVERGEPGRLVTPAVLYAYEKATGIRLTGTAGHRTGEQHEGGWRRGQLTEVRRRWLNGRIAAVAYSGILGEPVGRTLNATGGLHVPATVTDSDVAQLEQLTASCTHADMRFGGGMGRPSRQGVA